MIIKPQIFVLSCSLLLVHCKKESQNEVVHPPASPPTASPSKPRDNLYHKSKWAGYYINISDAADTFFIYTDYMVQNGDTNVLSENGQFVDSTNLGQHYLYTKHIAEHWGGNYAKYAHTLIGPNYAREMYPHFGCQGGSIGARMKDLTIIPGIGTMQPMPESMKGVNRGLTMGMQSFCYTLNPHQINLFYDSIDNRLHLTFNDLLECKDFTGPMTYTFVRR